MEINSQLKISELEQLLADARQTYGDVPLVFWDQEQSVTFNRPKSVLLWNSTVRALYLGGFHVNGDKFVELPEGVFEALPPPGPNTRT